MSDPFTSYKLAADRIRSSQAHAMDLAVCDWYGRLPQPEPAKVAGWWDLPVARSCWDADLRRIRER